MSKQEFLPLAKLREQQIEAQMSALAAELEELRLCRRIYERLTASTAANALPAGSTQIVGFGLPSARTAKAQILAAVVEILGSGQPRTTKDLVQELEVRGVAVGGTDKVSNLGALLSREKQLFRNIRGRGYALLDMAAEKTEAAGADTPAAPLVQL